MTRTEERLADALGAAARAVRDDTLRPLLVPARRRSHRSLAVSLAAAAAVLLVAGLAVTTTRYLPQQRVPSPATAPPAYYVTAGYNGGPPVVRSTVTGARTATVRVPRTDLGYAISSTANGIFFAAAIGSGSEGVVIYRFRLSAAGQVLGLSRVRDGALANKQWSDYQWSIGAFAASPSGSRLAVALASNDDAGINGSFNLSNCHTAGQCASPDFLATANDQIDVLDTVTGKTAVWQGGTGRGYTFAVIGLSWTSGNELVYYGQWCPNGGTELPASDGPASCGAATGSATGIPGMKAEVWALDPARPGGKLNSGRLLFQAPATYPYLAQAVISPDGKTITVAALTSSPGGRSADRDLAVEQISVPSGKRLSIAYTRALDVKGGDFLAPVTLSADGPGQHWLLSGAFCTLTDPTCPASFNGWIDRGRLVTLQPAGLDAEGGVDIEAW
jgi:hypothetical protein